MGDFGNTPDNKKKYENLYVYIIAAVAVIFASIWFGYVYETEENIFSAVSNMPNYMSPINLIKGIANIFGSNGKQTKCMAFGLGGAVLIVMYKLSGSNKRYHRKGSEHGSARWGSQKEKDIISDTVEFYNNVIAASDVFLVLDRKKREENENRKKVGKEEKKALKKAVRNAKKAQKAERKAAKKKSDTEDVTDNNITVTEKVNDTMTDTVTEPKESEKSSKTEKEKEKKEEILTVTEVKKMKKKTEKIKPMLNLNMMILGGSGTGKSRFYVKPNLMQCNTSFVVTDPSGELLQSCGKMLERMGYKIKVFNINDMKHSSNYNPFHYLKDFDGNINNNNVIKMINTFMLNTKAEGASSGDQFWDDSTRLLLSALCFLLVETGAEEDQNFANVLDLIHKAKVIDGKEQEKSELDLIMEKHKEDSPDALSVQYYDEFKQAAGKTMQSILISTTTKLQHFKLEDVRNLTFKDNIHLETVGDVKTALFIIIPSTDTTYNFLAAMMYSQLFDTLYDRAINYFHGRLPCHVSFICDEFANIGKIPDFDKILATCRKFEISAVVILQSLSQLKRIYEKSWEELPGNCDTLIYLGGQDQFTNEYLVKALGKETIDTLAINKTKSKQGSTSYNDGILGRELATIDELARMDNNDCIVIVRGMPPFFTPKFDISNHPRYNMLDEADKENNTFYLEQNVFTDTEGVTIDLSEFYDEPDNEQGDIVIKYLTSDKGIVRTEDEMMSDVPAELRTMFDKMSVFTVG